jgi:transcriptional regulator with XRE-family HTH domain
MVNNIVGPQVRLARNLHSPPLTQDELAARLQLGGWDISRSGIAKIEMGLRRVTDIEVSELARALNVPVEWLFKDSEAT